MTRDIHRFAPQCSLEPHSLNCCRKTREQHSAHCHLVYDRVEPFKKQNPTTGPSASHITETRRPHLSRRDHRGQRQSRLLKSFRHSLPEAAHADISGMREMLPPWVALSRDERSAHVRNLCLPSSSLDGVCLRALFAHFFRVGHPRINSQAMKCSVEHTVPVKVDLPTIMGDDPMSTSGQKQTFAPQKVMSALPPKADMCSANTDVRFGPKADIVDLVRSV